jgi:EmrB/QacA subfamily drug resistance transporter
MEASGGAPGAPDYPGPARARAILFVVVLGVLMAAVDSTIIVLALPTVGQELSASLSDVVWTILIYLLILAVVTTPFGKVGDLFGRARMFNIGFAVFTLGSALCGLAPSTTLLIAFRAIQAIGGALLMATGGALIAENFPPARRGEAFGYLAFGYGIGAVLGILLGGVITTLLGWRFIFFINVPIGLVALVVGLRALRDGPRRAVRIDWGGFALLGGALGGISYGAIDIASYGVDATNLAWIVAGLVLAGVFLWWERRVPEPTIDLTLFREPGLARAYGALFFLTLGYLSVIFLLTMYLQGLRGLSPLDAALLLVPAYLVTSLASPRMGRLADRFGTTRIATIGIVIALAGVLAYSFLSVSTPLLWIVPVSLGTGLGSAMFWPANSAWIMSHARQGNFGSLSGLRGTMANIGTLLSYVITLTVASTSVPRYVAFEVFLGSTHLAGGIGASFLGGLRAALLACAGFLVVAALIAGTGRSTAPTASAGAPRSEPAGP